jgi:hypothetical protein
MCASTPWRPALLASWSDTVVEERDCRDGAVSAISSPALGARQAADQPEARVFRSYLTDFHCVAPGDVRTERGLDYSSSRAGAQR